MTAVILANWACRRPWWCSSRAISAAIKGDNIAAGALWVLYLVAIAGAAAYGFSNSCQWRPSWNWLLGLIAFGGGAAGSIAGEMAYAAVTGEQYNA